jgi:nitrogen fixation/metabolism regulation signal transduction histidine kinase
VSAGRRFSLSIRKKFLLYLLVLHAVFAAILTVVAWSDRIWLLGVEFLFLISFLVALWLFRLLFRPLEVLTAAAEIMKGKDFTTRFRPVGQPEMDSLIEMYNQMIGHLQLERTRQEEQQLFLEKILSVSPAGMITLDYDDRIALVNPSAVRMLGVPAAALAGRPLADLRTPFSRALAELPAGEPQVITLEGMRRVKCHKAHFIDRGFPRNFILLEELTEELRQSEKAAYEKLIRMMSHEVNNSLGAANSLLYSVLTYKTQLRKEDMEDFAGAIAVVISRTEHLNTFMKEYADIVRLPAPRKTPTDVADILKNIQVLMSAESERRRISWQWKQAAPPETVVLDRAQIEQALVNVVKNAMEAIGHDGKITVVLGRENGRQYVAIEDTGSGISPETRKHLFTPFFTTKENGQGIGLTAIREIFTRHEFPFSLESEGPGATRFIVWM